MYCRCSMSAADVIYIARQRAGLSQRELGERAGIAQNAVARIENGHVEPSFALVTRLLRAADHDLDFKAVVRERSWEADIRRRLQITPTERVAMAATHSNVLRRLQGIARTEAS